MSCYAYRYVYVFGTHIMKLMNKEENTLCVTLLRIYRKRMLKKVEADATGVNMYASPFTVCIHMYVYM